MIENTPRRYLRVPEVAARLGISASRVRMIPASDLPYVKLDPERGWRAYAEGDVAAYLERRTVRA